MDVGAIVREQTLSSAKRPTRSPIEPSSFATPPMRHYVQASPEVIPVCAETTGKPHTAASVYGLSYQRGPPRGTACQGSIQPAKNHRAAVLGGTGANAPVARAASRKTGSVPTG